MHSYVYSSFILLLSCYLVTLVTCYLFCSLLPIYRANLIPYSSYVLSSYFFCHPSLILLSGLLGLPAICFSRCFQYIVLISFLIHRMSYPLISSFILLLSLILLSGLLWLPAICFALCFQYILLRYSLFILALILLVFLSSFSYLVILFTLVKCYLFCS